MKSIPLLLLPFLLPSTAQASPKTVHIVPHSHDDLGWLQTLDEYYSADKGVKNILNSVIQSLMANPERKFSYAEMKFMSMWWQEQSEEVRNQTKELVRNGQLEIVGGGWSANDEACPSYWDILNNYQIGHKFVLDNFGIKPRVGWQIDAFGHSSTNIRFFAEMGFDAVFMARIDATDKAERARNKELEWIHKPYQGEETQIFAHEFSGDLYRSPPGFNFDEGSTDPEWINDQRSRGYNAPSRAKSLLNHLRDKASKYRTNDLLVLFGDDFAYSHASLNYENMDRMIEYMNEHHSDEFVLQYSTPSDYIDKIKEYDIEWPTTKDDLYPYHDFRSSYWSGFYTSRPLLKQQIKKLSQHFRASSQVYSLNAINKRSKDNVLAEAITSMHNVQDVLGVMQHHDAITGTSKTRVAADYQHKMTQAIQENTLIYERAILEHFKTFYGLNIKNNAHWTQCKDESNDFYDCPISSLAHQPNFEMHVILHNPSNLITSSLTIQAPAGNYKVQSYDIQSKQYIDVNSNISCKKQLGYKNPNSSGIRPKQQIKTCALKIDHSIQAKSLSVMKIKQINKYKVPANKAIEEGNETIESDELRIRVLEAKKGARSIKLGVYNKQAQKEEVLEMKVKWYKSTAQAQNEGAYIFRPDQNQNHALKYTFLKHTEVLGQDEMRFQFANGKDNLVEMKVSIDVDLQVIKATVEMDGMPDPHHNAYDAVVVFQLDDFKNDGVFYTDSNGLEMEKRVLNDKDSENWVASNWYPITSAITINDENGVFSVMNDHSQGGSSLKNGEIQIMQNRNGETEDRRGMSEAVDEKDVHGNRVRVGATYYIDIYDRSQRESRRGDVQEKVDNPIQFFYNVEPLHISHFKLGSSPKEPHLSSTHSQIQTEPLSKGKLKLTVVNLSNKTENLSKSALIKDIWFQANSQPFDSYALSEDSLSGTMPIEEAQERTIKWKTQDDQHHPEVKESKGEEQGDIIKMEHMKIRVYQLAYNYTQETEEMEEMKAEDAPQNRSQGKRKGSIPANQTMLDRLGIVFNKGLGILNLQTSSMFGDVSVSLPTIDFSKSTSNLVWLGNMADKAFRFFWNTSNLFKVKMFKNTQKHLTGINDQIIEWNDKTNAFWDKIFMSFDLEGDTNLAEFKRCLIFIGENIEMATQGIEEFIFKELKHKIVLLGAILDYANWFFGGEIEY